MRCRSAFNARLFLSIVAESQHSQNVSGDKDGMVTTAELDGNRMADRIKALGKDVDDVITREEFRNGMSTLFGRRRGGDRARDKETRPDRPQRRELAES